jgi:hypothetical protein
VVGALSQVELDLLSGGIVEDKDQIQGVRERGDAARHVNEISGRDPTIARKGREGFDVAHGPAQPVSQTYNPVNNTRI